MSEEIYQQIKKLQEEASANLTLYTTGHDDNALVRYNYLMSAIRTLREKSNSSKV